MVILMAHMRLSSQTKKQGEGSPVSRKRLESASKSKLNPIQTPEKEPESQEADTESQDTQESQPPVNEACQAEYVCYISLVC